eukprot:jgi/Mesen1/7663/ME000400S06855
MRLGILRTGMGWVEAVGDRVGRLVSNEKRNAGFKTNILQEDSGHTAKERGDSEEMQEYGKQSSSHTRPGSIDSEDEFSGPDTSSLTAFLLSLLSYSGRGKQNDGESTSSGDEDDDSFYSDDDEVDSREARRLIEGVSPSGDSHTEQDVWGDPSLVSPGENLAGSSDAHRWEDGSREGVEGGAASPFHGAQQDAAALRKTMSCAEGGAAAASDKAQELSRWHSESMPPLPQLVPQPMSPVRSPRSPKLPAMAEESFLLTDFLRAPICSNLPALASGREWVLLYSTIKHGISLLTLYRRSALLAGPCLLVIGDKKGAVFGGLSSGPLKASNRKKYQGTSDSFVFSDVSGSLQLFRATGINRYFVLCMNEALAFGGGGHFAFRIDQELLSGTSGACETFGSPCLARSEEFTIKHIELWGFAHASQYAPAKAAWHEPEMTPGISSW